LSILNVRHTTVYRYRRPVALGDHRLMLRPRDSHDLRLIQTNLNLSPPATLRWSHDVFGNSIAIGEAVIRIWSNLPQEVQDHLFKEAVASQGESIRSQLAVFLHDKHSRTADPLGKAREMPEPDSLGG
jgi:hypothetical protein